MTDLDFDGVVKPVYKIINTYDCTGDDEALVIIGEYGLP